MDEQNPQADNLTYTLVYGIYRSRSTDGLLKQADAMLKNANFLCNYVRTGQIRLSVGVLLAQLPQHGTPQISASKYV